MEIAENILNRETFYLINEEATVAMVCFPCFVVPVALLFWRFLLWPLLRPLYIRWYNVPKEQQASDKNMEKLDKLGEDGCPFGCPMKPKDNSSVSAEEKKVL